MMAKKKACIRGSSVLKFGWIIGESPGSPVVCMPGKVVGARSCLSLITEPRSLSFISWKVLGADKQNCQDHHQEEEPGNGEEDRQMPKDQCTTYTRGTKL